MSSIKALKNKIGSTKSIGKITKTMEMVATSKMKRAIERASATREYTEHALELLSGLSKEEYLKHPLLLRNKASAKTLIILLSSDKGLCGGFNVSLARAVHRYVENHKQEESYEFITVGKYAEQTAQKMDQPIVASFLDMSDNLHAQDVDGIYDLALQSFEEGTYQKVLIVYANFISALTYRPVIREILPVRPHIVKNILEEIEHTKEATEESPKEEERSLTPSYIFEPTEERVLDFVLRTLFETMIYQALLESKASEHSARRVAMKNATDNAEEMVDNLTLQYNRVRQGAITQEISEISAGVEALE